MAKEFKNLCCSEFLPLSASLPSISIFVELRNQPLKKILYSNGTAASSLNPLSEYLLRSSKSMAETRCSIARVSGARMAAAKSQGWVYASLKMENLGSADRNWSQLDNQNPLFPNFPAGVAAKEIKCQLRPRTPLLARVLRLIHQEEN